MMSERRRMPLQDIVDHLSADDERSREEALAGRYAMAVLIAQLHLTGVFDGAVYTDWLRAQCEEGAVIGDRGALVQLADMIDTLLEAPTPPSLSVVRGGGDVRRLRS
jgi:hypothetical protein